MKILICSLKHKLLKRKTSFTSLGKRKRGNINQPNKSKNFHLMKLGKFEKNENTLYVLYFIVFLFLKYTTNIFRYLKRNLHIRHDTFHLR